MVIVQKMNGIPIRLGSRPLTGCLRVVTWLAIVVALSVSPTEAIDDSTVKGGSRTVVTTDSPLLPAALYPVFDSALAHWKDPATYGRQILDNGLTILVKTSPDSGPTAICLAGINRTGLEPVDRTGITYFLNQCLRRDLLKNDAPTSTDDAEPRDTVRAESQDTPELAIKLFNSRSRSFLGIEIEDGHAEFALDRLTAMLTEPRLDSETVEAVRREILEIIAERTESVVCVASDKFYNTLLENHPLAEPIFGTQESVTLISVDDLRSHCRRYYSPNNLILAIVGAPDSADVFGWVLDRLADWPPVALFPDSPARPESSFAVREVRAAIESDTVAVFAGGLVPRSLSEDALPLQIAVTILSERLQNNMLQRLGLGFSAKAEVVFDLRFGWYNLAAVTDPGSYRAVLNRMVLQTEKLALDGPSVGEVATARDRLWSSYSTVQSSRLDQAHFLALDGVLGRNPSSGTDFLSALSRVEAADVRRVAARFFRPELWTIATAGRID